MYHPDTTKNNFASKKFDSLLRHRCSGFKKNTDKVWHCQSVGKLKGVGQPAIAKINELRIHTIADLQLHVRHRGKVFLDLDLALALALALDVTAAFMMNEAEKLTKGSVHEDNFYIAHDALVLMTAKETINWMKQKGYLHCWLLALNGL